MSPHLSFAMGWMFSVGLILRVATKTRTVNFLGIFKVRYHRFDGQIIYRS